MQPIVSKKLNFVSLMFKSDPENDLKNRHKNYFVPISLLISLSYLFLLLFLYWNYYLFLYLYWLRP